MQDIIQYLKSYGLEYIDNYKKYGRTYIQFICNKHKDRGIQEIRIDRLYIAKTICKYCRGYGSTVDDLKSIKEINNDVEILSDKIINVDTKILCRCKHCGNEWWITPAKLKAGRRCPECKKIRLRKLKQKSNSIIQRELQENNPNVEIIGEYINSQSMIRCRCKIHKIEWDSQTWNILHGLSGCPICNASMGENLVASILESLSIKYIRQHSFDDCIYKQKLRFDFYLPDYNICIEYQGEQHYFPVNFKGKGNTDYLSEYENNLIRDNIKRDYCNKNNILLIEIPYWDKDNSYNIITQYIKTRRDCNT